MNCFIFLCRAEEEEGGATIHYIPNGIMLLRYLPGMYVASCSRVVLILTRPSNINVIGKALGRFLLPILTNILNVNGW